MTTSVLPDRLNTDTLPALTPPVPTFTVTALGMVRPGVQFRFDAVGRDWSAGHRVRNDEPVVLVTVTFSTTASASAGHAAHAADHRHIAAGAAGPRGGEATDVPAPGT